MIEAFRNGKAAERCADDFSVEVLFFFLYCVKSFRYRRMDLSYGPHAIIQLRQKMFSHMISASSLSDLLHTYEDMVQTMFLATKSVSKDSM